MVTGKREQQSIRGISYETWAKAKAAAAIARQSLGTWLTEAIEEKVAQDAG